MACSYAPTQIAEAVRVRFGVKVTRQQVHGYDPESSQPPGEHWIALHAQTRALFVSEMAETAAAHRSDVLELLDRPGQSSESLQERAARFLEQVDRERGRFYQDAW